jgi:hypothetical protein
MGIGMGRRLRWATRSLWASACLLGALVVAFGTGLATTGNQPGQSPRTAPPAALTAATSVAPSFHYGFDLSSQEPTTASNVTGADVSARRVLDQFAGSFVDQSMYGFGADVDPEPRPGVYRLTGLGERLSLIEAAGGVPVVTLIGAPSWMRPGSKTFYDPPAPAYYQAFATLCAHVAQTFPQVKYFVVWNELKGFWDTATDTWNFAAYTSMYNDVYAAIKKVRPTAMVGGPYATMTAWSAPVRNLTSSVHGPFGYLDQGMLNAVSYWLAHKVGADFIAVDGATENAKAGTQVVDAVTAANQYAVVDHWIRSQTTLPIWWMESHIEPAGWTTAQGAAARVATLAEMASSGASVGMQWQPQDQAGWPDEGLWTSTLGAGGGQETALAQDLLSVLPVLQHGPVLATGEPAGVLVATDASGTLAVNTTASPVTATAAGKALSLAPGQVALVG